MLPYHYKNTRTLILNNMCSYYYSITISTLSVYDFTIKTALWQALVIQPLTFPASVEEKYKQSVRDHSINQNL